MYVVHRIESIITILSNTLVGICVRAYENITFPVQRRFEKIDFLVQVYLFNCNFLLLCNVAQYHTPLGRALIGEHFDI